MKDDELKDRGLKNTGLKTILPVNMLRLRVRNAVRRLVRASIVAFAIPLVALVASLFMGGLDERWLVITFLLMVISFCTLAIFPRTVIPDVVDLRKTPLPQLADKGGLWLEANRPLLPPRSRAIADRLTAGLDQLSPQLTRLDARHPAAHEVRKLIDEHLPALVESYVRIPAPLRDRPHAGSTPEAQLNEGLTVLAREIETMSGEIARGELDALATRGRYLETRYIDTRPDDNAARQ